MVFPNKIIIYFLVFIFAKLFDCIDAANETASVTVDEHGINTSITTESTTEQITKPDSAIEPPLENGNAMQMCNQTFRTPKGTV